MDIRAIASVPKFPPAEYAFDALINKTENTAREGKEYELVTHLVLRKSTGMVQKKKFR